MTPDVGDDSMKWIKAIVIIAIGVVAFWLVWRWALPPGFWGGSMLSGVDETDEQVARRVFGPIIFQTSLLHGSHNGAAFRQWGMIETVCRLIAIIIGQFVVSTVAIIMISRNSPTNRCASRR